MNKPNLYVVAAPSGGGKTSLIRALLESEPGVRLSVSHTTRPPRPGETDGKHYHFVGEKIFLGLIEQNAFLEHACVFDHRYGTSRQGVEEALSEGYDVVLDIDWQGARQIRDSFPSSRSIFIVPPSLESLRERLIARGQDSERVIRRRMRDARAEISHWNEFDYLIINEQFGNALAELRSIIRSGRAPRSAGERSKTKILAELLGTG